MTTKRRCHHTKADGSPCRAAPLHDAAYCLMHSPEHEAEMAEARRLGGLRRRREATVTAAYGLEDVVSPHGLLRVLEIAMLDSLGLENSIARSRALATLTAVALRAVEAYESDARLAAPDGNRSGPPPSPWQE